MNLLALLAMASAALAAALNDKHACHGNHCNRAVTGRNLPSAVRKADCSSFLRTTVTPSPVIKTYWIGDNSFYYDTAITAAVTHTATATPAYAAVCSANTAYAAACRCYGITGATTTAARPTVTVTRTGGCT